MTMDAASTSETSVNFYQTTRRNNPEDSHLHTRRRENLKSYQYTSVSSCLHQGAPCVLCNADFFTQLVNALLSCLCMLDVPPFITLTISGAQHKDATVNEEVWGFRGQMMMRWAVAARWS
jgi:hypothetical protein